MTCVLRARACACMCTLTLAIKQLRLPVLQAGTVGTKGLLDTGGLHRPHVFGGVTTSLRAVWNGNCGRHVLNRNAPSVDFVHNGWWKVRALEAKPNLCLGQVNTQCRRVCDVTQKTSGSDCPGSHTEREAAAYLVAINQQ